MKIVYFLFASVLFFINCRDQCIGTASKKSECTDYELTDTEKLVGDSCCFVKAKGKYNGQTVEVKTCSILKKDESIDDCIIREIREETGIYLRNIGTPFLNITTYDDNYFNTHKKVENSIYYYRVVSDAIPDLSSTEYDDIELQSEFNLFYVKLSDFENFINNCISPRRIVEFYHSIFGFFKYVQDFLLKVTLFFF